MKNILIISIIMLFSSLAFSQNSDEDVFENSINTKMIRWSSEWWVDSYNNNSIDIIDIDRSNSSEWFITGTFWVTRAGQRLKMNFTSTAKIYSNNTFKLTKLCYDDPSVGDKDCKYY